MEELVIRAEPRTVWKHFESLSAVPRPSKKEDRVIRFILDFGANLELETRRDAVGNVVIRKPASKGMEGRTPVVLQAHLDMVHQKNDATEFDFDNEGIRMYRDGDWVRARGTTLGADNGLGVAAIMAVLESDDLAHPPLEALFTIDEETGMTGAKGLQPGWLKGKILLNLDTEEDDELSVGCAGGVDVTGTSRYEAAAVPAGWRGYEIQLLGLQGGHSGMDIHKGPGNANKLLARLLYACYDAGACGLHLLTGGTLRNAIPREARAVLSLNPDRESAFREAFERERTALLEENRQLEPGLEITMSPADVTGGLLPEDDAGRLLRCLLGLHNGVVAMSAEFPGQTETSNNVARVAAGSGEIQIGCLARSSREGAKEALVRQLEAVFTLAGFRTETSGEYPGWEPAPDSAILELVTKRYRDLFGEPPRILAGHGGLECGIIKDKYPDLDMISFGPTIRGAHSPDERASIPSTSKFWKLLTDVLAHIPERN
ncbi:aminoacyl-histidine dipeptidase [Robiginitalea biformata]|uniref:Cytosol non-specific dipeptidase n=1 Tax=Robiginitalea biformata (strain ATCC BAA-864 / DSM 15991 / KCTC 12146 / HTCC2501) TaxID=313596 RepID=A4CQ20_ROBBH|nr:aminoacyl-histidine dipeptidase [Robiginitalea biformata]EAR14105.1 aminoacyl-histidine dipeptidase [Robiginitalea biformata HTCC2501]